MRKEITVAVLAGLSIGLVIAFGVYRINSKKPIPQTINQISQNFDAKVNEDTPEPFEQASLTLTNIEDGSIYTESPVIVSGVAVKKSSVLISTESEDFVITLKPDYTFTQEIKLSKGINKVMVTALDSNGVITESRNFTVVYYPDFEKDINS